MPDREKVIKGLECCMSEKMCRNKCPYKGQCDDGGYYYSRAIEDALELLKAQEPRVLMMSEVRDCCPDCVYIETNTGWLERTIMDYWQSDSRFCVLVYGKLDNITKPWKEYGKTWRVWSARPSEEQREAVRWDD